ncbi:amidohydrolase family protein [Tunturibacter empetritectus]|uniref:6-methylsalicylate decarboxylase n=1 Tax=Tunturiibacter empetritectus TaxID=3069691 RepID=A0AAU7ZGD7_9BACT
MSTIDVHSHVLPDIYLNALQKAGITNIDGFSTPDWSVEDHLKMMDSHKIQACVLSLSSPGLEFAEPGLAAELARTINILFSEIICDNPARFGAFALLPLPNVEAALQEIDYALDVLKLDGVGLFTNYGGVYLGDPRFAPVLDELHRRRAVAFVHPTTPAGSDRLTLGYPAPMLEYPFDTTRMAVSLLDTDTIERCSHVRFIFSHGGGALPLLVPRIGPLMVAKNGGNKLSALINIMRVERQVKSCFFDLTAATSPAYLAALKETHDPSRLLMGFDFPFMPPVSIGRAKDGVSDFEGFSEQEKSAIDQTNAEKLFPRLIKAIEQASRSAADR